MPFGIPQRKNSSSCLEICPVIISESVATEF